MAIVILTRTLLVAACLSLAPVAASAQADAAGTDHVELYELVLNDGSRAFGTVEIENAKEVVFRTHAGARITAPRSEIVSLRLVKGRLDAGQFVPSDRHRSRLFFAPTGRSLERGQVAVGVFEFLAPFVQVGVTDRFSVGGGTPLVIGFDEKYRPFWFTPKFQVYGGPSGQAAIGVLQMFNPRGDSAGIAYGVGTVGSTDNALTVGAGLGYAGDAATGIVMAGGERRVRRNLKLITENYLWKGGDGIVSGGVRFLGERLSADVALAVPVGFGEIVAFPVVNFVYVF